jgi:hypothetical protein
VKSAVAASELAADWHVLRAVKSAVAGFECRLVVAAWGMQTLCRRQCPEIKTNMQPTPRLAPGNYLVPA